METTTRNFIEELDKITLEKWEKIYDALKGTTDVYSITFGVFPPKELLEEFGLNEKFNFSITNENGSGKMNYFYNGSKIKPESYYLLPDNYREVSLMEMFQECIRQNTNQPDIKHLQVDQNKQVEKPKLGSTLSSLKESVFNDEDLIGKTTEEARELCTKNNLKFRVTLEDGKAYIITMDLHGDRVNVHVENGIVIKAYRG